MTTLQLLVHTILIVGTAGYPVAFVLVLRLRRWLGDAGSGWIRVTMNGLLWLLAVLAVLFGLSLASHLGLLRGAGRGWAVALSVGTVGAMALAPWGLVLGLHIWRRRAIRRERERERDAQQGGEWCA